MRCCGVWIGVMLAGWIAAGCGDDGGGSPPVVRFRALSFNTGSGGATGGFAGGEWTAELKDIGDEYYGNGLAWQPAVEATRRWLAEVEPDVVVFQEIFHTPDCADIPAAQREQFICEQYDVAPALPVARIVLGAGYQVMCHLGKPDKCGAVKTSFGRFRGCAEDFCLEGLAGARVPDCGRGSRVGRGVIELVAGGSLTLVNFHGSSGVSAEDERCRLAQVDQVFVDLGDGTGQPAANGARNLIMGDLNVDPVLWASFDPSAARWLDFAVNPDDAEATADRPFHFHSEVGQDAPASYAGLFNIDHVLSDAATGGCWVAGITPGHPHVLGDEFHFDHKPVVCDLEMAERP